MTIDPIRATPAQRAWLRLLLGLIAAMVLLGAYTRLSGSGLSMVDWQPITGAFFSLDAEAMKQAFAAYQQTPEYRLKNSTMSLEAFRFIFLVEFSHRQLGRLMGLVLLIPMLYWKVRSQMSSWLWRRCWVLLIGGLLQAVAGWYMVKSGLIQVPAVSQYRLLLHASVALFLLGFCYWVYLHSDYTSRVETRPFPVAVRVLNGLLPAVLIAGVLMAGTDAGLVLNTFPKIAGSWFPAAYFSHTPWWINPFESVHAIHFNHRLLATLLLGWLLIMACWYRKQPRVYAPTLVLLALVLLQWFLGITLVLLKLPLWPAWVHTGNAMLILLAWLYLNDRCQYSARPVERTVQ